MSHPLSKKQLEVLKALEGFARARGHIPSVRELATRLRKSPTTVFQHLKALERRGYLKGDGSAHGWRLLLTSELPAIEPSVPTLRVLSGSGAAAAPVRARIAREPHLADDADEGEAIEEAESDAVGDVPAGWVRVPIAGTIAAGLPIEAIDEGLESRIFPEEMVPEGAFALRVKGESMIDDHILNGDLVIVRPQDEVNDGEIAVALLDDGSATLKRVFREKGRVRLQPANPTMDPIYADNVRIQGRVVGVWRCCS
ncbi:MAG TPA: transcriptional repressor LexA [Planctomycetota bacterium]|jgi:repressor LexA|nr:transcriptional repressor LexA [Planctomycetota bacterium]